MTLFTAVLAAALAAPSFAAEPKPMELPKPAGEKPALSAQQQTFYGLGVWLSQQVEVFHLTGDELNLVKQGLGDAVLGKKLKVDPTQIGPKLSDLAKSRRTAALEKENKLAKALLDKAAAEAGAKKLSDGVVFRSIAEGSGDSPRDNDTAKFHMIASADGKIFEDTTQRAPAEAPPGETGIDCLKEALEMMKPGGKAKVTCPAAKAFGDQGHPPTIPGGAAVVFELQLVGVTKGLTPAEKKAAEEKAAAENKTALETAAKEPGAKKTKSGLIIKITKEGSGSSPKATDRVKVNYRGTFVDGKEFDANKGIEFGLNQVIKCWTEGLQLVKVGGSAKLTCPGDIAYGPEGRPGIPPNATLVFDVDLLEIEK